MKSITIRLLLSWSICFGACAESVEITQTTLLELLNKHSAGFANLEHQQIGNQVTLRFPSPVEQTPYAMLHLPNGLVLSYGDIVMFGGDFFGNPKFPVSSCTSAAQKQCFMEQFNNLAANVNKDDKSCSSPFNKTQNITLFFNEVRREIERKKQQGIPEYVFYEQNEKEFSKKLNRLTCGGSFISDYLPFGDFLNLAKVNFDHFLPDAMTAYKAGHAVALETAVKAHDELARQHPVKAQNLLELAYAQNAFASHYLSDSFSAGHIRTPRREIHNKVNLPAILNLLVANLMHDEDNKLGLQVVNSEGLTFKVYGDGYLSKDEARTQRFVMHEAMQRSADGIYQAFITGQIPQHYSELMLVVDESKIEQLNLTAPLFKMENGILLKRKNRKAPYDHQWTAIWSGLISLLE